MVVKTTRKSVRTFVEGNQSVDGRLDVRSSLGVTNLKSVLLIRVWIKHRPVSLGSNAILSLPTRQNNSTFAILGVRQEAICSRLHAKTKQVAVPVIVTKCG